MKICVGKFNKKKTKVILTKNTVMERKNTENCTNVCKLTNCRLSTLILTNEKQDEMFTLVVKQSREDRRCTLYRDGTLQNRWKGLHIRLSLEKIQHTRKGSVLFIILFETEPFHITLPPLLFKTHIDIFWKSHRFKCSFT